MRVFSDIGSGLIKRWDVDRAQLAALSSVQRRSGLAVAPSAAVGGRAWFYLKFTRTSLLGLAGVVGILSQSFFLGLAFSYTLIMLIFGLTFISYLTAVLLDTGDNRILLHLPISGRTLLAARLIGLAEYAALLALSISLPTAVALAIRFGAVALLVFVISIVLMLILLVAVTLALCLFALRHFNPRRTRQAILYLQTSVFMLAIYVGSVFLNAGVPLATMVDYVSGKAWWYFYPPGWMAGLLDYSLMEKTHFNSVLAATAVLVPLAGFVGCILLFGGGRFTALLSRLEVVPHHRASTPRRLPRWLARLSELISVLINGDRQQRAVLRFTSKLMKSDQALKLRAYTFIGSLLVNMGIVVATNRSRPLGNMGLVVCYYMPLVMAVMAPFIQYGAEWRAGWCYQVLPFEKPGVILSGAMKAYIWKYIFPIYLVLLTVSAVVWGTVGALDALFAGAVTTLICVVLFWGTAPAPPYSREFAPDGTRKGGRLRKFVFIPIAFGLVVTHIVLKTVAGNWGVAAGIVAMGGIIIVAFRNLQFMGARDVKARDHHVGWHRSQN